MMGAGGEPLLIEIVNPNPRAVAVWQGDVLVSLLKTHDRTVVPLLDGTRMSCDGRAIVVCSFPGTGDEEWLQAVGPKPAAPDFEKRLDPKEAAKDAKPKRKAVG